MLEPNNIFLKMQSATKVKWKKKEFIYRNRKVVGKWMYHER